MFWPGGEWRKIESDVNNTVAFNLKENGIDWAKVDTNDRGRDVLLSGSAPSEEAKSTAIRIAEELSQDKRGNAVARIVEWQGDIVEPVIELQPGKLSFTAVDNKITLNGVVANEDQKAALVDAANRTYGASNVIDRLSIGENILPIEQIGSLVSDFGLPDGTLRVSLEKGLKITGEVDSEGRKLSIGENLQNALGSDYSVKNLLSVALQPGKLSFTAVDNKITLNGVVANEDQKAALVDAANRTYGASNVIDRLSIGENILPIEQIGSLVSDFGLPDGTLRVSLEKGLKITGEVDSEGRKLSIGENLQNALGSDYSVKNLLSVVIPEPEPEPVVIKEPEPVIDIAAICQAKVKELMSDSKIFFATAKAEIKSESYALLDNISAVLAECSESAVEVSGHTDSTGSQSFNQPLSLNRAKAVVDYLVSKGVDANRLTSEGFGAEKPVADNSTKEGRAANRRIEFTVK